MKPLKRNHFDLRKQLPVIARAGSSRFPRMVARYLGIVLVLFVLGVWFLPWQQSASASGKVIAFDPLDRRINVEAPVSGNVRKLHVVEGQMVKKGAVIAEIEAILTEALNERPNLNDFIRFDPPADAPARGAA